MMMRLKENIGFIGCGSMGSAILAGLIRSRIVRPRQVFVYDPDPRRTRRVHRDFSVRTCHSNSEVLKRSQIILLAMKPQNLNEVAAEIQAALKNHLVISILAGTPLSKLRRVLGRRLKIGRAMPNLGAKVGESLSAITGERNVLGKMEAIFSGCGRTLNLPERQFNLYTAVCGSGPAFFFYLIERLTDFAVKSGMRLKAARKGAAQVAFAAGKLARESGLSSSTLRSQVTSKKGTTEAAFSVLLEHGMNRIFEEALRRAVRRAQEISRS